MQFETKELIFSASNLGLLQGLAIGPDDCIYASVGCTLMKIDSENQVSTFSGSVRGFRNGDRRNSQFQFVRGLLFVGNVLYVCDAEDNRIRRVENDVVTTFCGNGVRGSVDGHSNVAQFSWPTQMVYYKGYFFLTDLSNQVVRIITKDGTVSTLAGTNLKRPTNICIASNRLFCSDSSNPCTLFELTFQQKSDPPVLDRQTPFMDSKATFMYKSPDLVHYSRKMHNANIYGLVSTQHGHLIATDSDNSIVLDFPLNKDDFSILASSRYKASSVAFKELRYPTFVQISSAGDLLVSEPPERRLRTIVGAFPSIWPLTSFLTCESIPPTLEFIHPSGDTAKKLHLRIFQLHSPSLTETTFQFVFGGSASIASLFPYDSVKYFLDSVYFAEPGEQLRNANPTLIAHALELASFLGFHQPETAPSQPSKSLETRNSVDFFVGLYNIFFNPCQNQKQIVDHLVAALRDTPLSAGHLLCNYLANIFSNIFENPEIEKTDVGSEDIDIDLAMSQLPSVFSERILQQLKSKSIGLIEVPTGISQYRGAKRQLAKMASEIKWTVPSSTGPVYPNDFTIAIEGHEKVIYVELWVLFARWSYMERAIKSGLQESFLRRLELPSSFPPQLLLEIIQYLYSNDPRGISETNMTLHEEFLETGDGAQFGFLDTIASPHFVPLLEKTRIVPSEPMSLSFTS